MNLALFDLDNTLLRGDSDYNWSKFLIKKNLLDKNLHEKQNEIFYQQYQNGTLDIYEFCEFQFRPLKENKRQDLDLIRQEYVEEIIKPLVSNKSIDLVKSHLRQNDLCIIITATNSYITKPIADLFDIDNLIGTIPEEIGGQFTGKVEGLPSFQFGKVTRLENWLAKKELSIESFDKSYFYSDSHNDLPLMKKVTNPICVNPDDKLKNEAHRLLWETISLED